MSIRNWIAFFILAVPAALTGYYALCWLADLIHVLPH